MVKCDGGASVISWVLSSLRESGTFVRFAIFSQRNSNMTVVLYFRIDGRHPCVGCIAIEHPVCFTLTIVFRSVSYLRTLCDKASHSGNSIIQKPAAMRIRKKYQLIASKECSKMVLPCRCRSRANSQHIVVQII